ncbi:MAG: hypothetical protein NC039_03970 [Muribaculaceae bacterium]|nr:hypothetical protein [Muribaculaceae bacterium]
MNILDSHDLLMWGVVIALVILASLTGMWLNRFFTHRAHRRALAELRRRAVMAEKGAGREAVATTVAAEVREI